MNEIYATYLAKDGWVAPARSTGKFRASAQGRLWWKWDMMIAITIRPRRLWPGRRCPTASLPRSLGMIARLYTSHIQKLSFWLRWKLTATAGPELTRGRT